MPKHFHEISNRRDLPEVCWHSVDYLSVEYIFTYEGESRVAFNIKTRLDDPDERDNDEEIAPKYAVYAVYRFSMEPSRWGHRGCVTFERQSNVIGYKPKDKNDRVPDFKPVACDSVAEFYLDLRRLEPNKGPYWNVLTNTMIIDEFYLSFKSLGTRLGPFQFHESKIYPYNYYDSRDVICQVFATLCTNGYIESPVILKARPLGVQQKLELPRQQDSEDYRFTFSKVISNLIFAQGEPEIARDDPLYSEKKKQGVFQKDHIQGVYQPIIRGKFHRHERQKAIRVQFEKWGEFEEICFPYNEDRSSIEQEIKACGTKVYEELKLKTRLYQDPPAAEATKTPKTRTTGPQQSTTSVRRRVVSPVPTPPQLVTATRTRKATKPNKDAVPAENPNTKSSVPATSLCTRTESPALRRQAKSRSLVKQPPSPTSPPAAARRGPRSATRALSPTARVAADSSQEIAQKSTPIRDSDLTPEPAKDATSPTVGSTNSQPAKGAVATKVANPQRANTSHRRTRKALAVS